MTAQVKGEDRFENDASRYAAYLETPEGRLRADLTFANLQDYLPRTGKSISVLDLGCGTGASVIRLARLGFHATLLDSSRAMLGLAERAIVDAGVSDKVTVQQGDVAQLAVIFRQQSFDFIFCHNLLEYVDDPAIVLGAAADLMRGSSAMISILVRNQAGEVLKAAIQNGDLVAAGNNLTQEWGTESLYGGKVRFFTPQTVEMMLTEASLTSIANRGVRVLSDYVPATISRSAEYERIFALEKRLSKRSEFYGIARYLHCLARCDALGLAKQK